jgi:acetyl-CoA C-acetyltransferase
MIHGRRVAVVGVGQTKHGFFPRETWKDMVVDSCYQAFEDCRMDPREIQTGFISVTMPELMEQENMGAAAADQLGISPVGLVQVVAACAGGGMGIRLGTMAIASGTYDRVLVVGVEKVSDGNSVETMSNNADTDYEYTYGYHYMIMSALQQTRYMDKYSVGPEPFELWPVHMRWYARLNPKAIDYGRPEMTLEDVRRSPWITWPLHTTMCAKACDASSAVILVPAEDARRYTDTPVYIDGVGMATGPAYQTSRFNYPGFEEFDIAESFTTMVAADEAYKMADCRPEDIDFAQIHDCFPPNAILQLEALRLFPFGQGAEAVLNGNIGIDGRMPTNTDGGRHCLGHPTGTTGINTIVEGVNQMRGVCGERQLRKADVGICETMGGNNATQSVTIIRR